MSTSPTVFLIDDDPVICQAIVWLLETIGLNTEVFSCGQEYLENHDPARYGCLLIDVRMPGMSGLKLQQELNKRYNPLPVIFITGHGDVPMAVEAMQNGAKDFILKPFNDQLFVEKVQATVLEDLRRENNVSRHVLIERFKSLTSREQQILELIAEGKLNKQIAAEINIALSTVETHRARIMQKLQVKTLAELIKITILSSSVKENHD